MAKAKINVMKPKIRSLLGQALTRIEQRKWQLAILIGTVLIPSSDVYAADAKWDSITGFFTPWIWKIGGAIALIGGVMLGMAVKDSDADGKSKAIKTMAGGVIVCAVGVSANIFLK